jgi:hypothetical protein
VRGENALRSVAVCSATVVLALGACGCSLDRSPKLLPGGAAGQTSAAIPGGQVAEAPVPEAPVPEAPVRSPMDTSSGGTFGSMPTPVIPDMPAQTGGLQCGGVFCPFARDPVRPCCSTQADVAQGAARAEGQCGLDFSATGASFYGSACWQTDQPGVADQSCPTAAGDAGLVEPGCCTDQGSCGGLNTSDAIGCHYQLGVKPQPCGMPSGDAGPGTTCDPLGIFGIEAQVDVAWGGRSGGLVGLTDDGRGKIVFHLLLAIQSIDTSTNEIQGQMRFCDVDPPPFYSTTLCESYKPVFPVTIWDNPKAPRFALTGRYSCLQPGCLLTMDAKTALLGIARDNPEAPWPGPQDTATLRCSAGTGAQCFPDQDGDKLPGVTISLLTDGMAPPGAGCASIGYLYKGAPLSASPAAIFGGVRRADRIFLGTRTKLGGSGKLSADCNEGTGLGVAQFEETRAWGCYVQQGTSNFPSPTVAGAHDFCQASEALFLDQNMPIYSILALGEVPNPMLKLADPSASNGPQFSFVRLGKVGDSVSCANVRNAAYR